MNEDRDIPARTVERLVQYRRILEAELVDGPPELDTVFSHELARSCHCTAAQVRRDLMLIGHHGSTSRGYDRRALLRAINALLGRCGMRRLVLAGAGRLGTALLSHFVDRSRMLVAVAVFDSDPAKQGRLISGVPCHAPEKLVEIVRKEGIDLGVITVPERAAQDVADAMVLAGIRGIVNFAPVAIRVPAGIVLETIDISGALDKIAFFVCQPPCREPRDP